MTGKYDFIKEKRYLVEVKGISSERVYLTERVATRLMAFYLRDKYDKWMCWTAKAFDTKTGNLLIVGKLEE